MSQRELNAPRISFMLKELRIRVFADHVEMDGPRVNLTAEETEHLAMLLRRAATHLRECATDLHSSTATPATSRHAARPATRSWAGASESPTRAGPGQRRSFRSLMT